MRNRFVQIRRMSVPGAPKPTYWYVPVELRNGNLYRLDNDYIEAPHGHASPDIAWRVIDAIEAREVTTTNPRSGS